jgi:hypothetical protein
MNGFLAFFAAMALVGVIAYLQIAYAKANYPSSWGWRLALFAPLFLLFTLLGYFLASGGDNTQAYTIVFSVVMGFIGGLLYTSWLVRGRHRTIQDDRPTDTPEV